MNIVPANDVREYDFVFLQFGLDLAPTGRLDRLQKTFKQFLFRRFPETFTAEMLYDHIHIGFIDGTESHVQRLLVNLRNRYGHVIGLVKIGNDAVGEICICIAVLIHQIIDDVERFELVVGIAFVIVVIIRMIVFVRGFAVLLVFELEFFFVLFRVLFEEGIPSVDLVERLVEQILLALTIDTVMFRNLVLVSYLHA